MKKTIAMIGTGIMGRGIALNLAKAGHSVRAYSRSPEKIRDLERLPELSQKSEKGGDGENNKNYEPAIKVCETISSATEDSDLTILCLTTDNSVEEAFREIQGTKIILDTGTTSVELTEKMQKISETKGIRFYDCPMTGSKLAAENGEILFMLGGSAEEAGDFQFFLDACGKKTIYCGGIGKGQKVKFALNMVQAGIYEVLLEGMKLAKGLGVPTETYFDVIDNSAAKSGISQFKLYRAIQGNYETHFALKNMYKDILHSLREADKLGLELPLCENLDKVYKQGISAGFGEEDFLSIVKSL